MSETLTTEQRAIKVIADYLTAEEEEVIPSADLRRDLGARESDVGEIFYLLEKEFDLEISGEERDRIKTVQDVFKCLDSLQSPT